MTELAIVNQDLVQGYLDNLGVSVVEKMLGMYVEQSQIYLNEIDDALQQSSQELWQERCHKMKGAAGSVGLMKVHRLLVDIEKSSDNLDTKATYLSELKALNREGIESFKQWLATA